MFDEPPSLPMRAALASVLGGCFALVLILATHGANAQAPAAAVDIAASAGANAGVADSTLGSLRVSAPGVGTRLPAMSRGLRVTDPGSQAGGSLRWQALPARAPRSDSHAPGTDRGDLFTLGVQVRF